MELTDEQKAQLKLERLQQYSVRIFGMRMDIAAYTAVGDDARLEAAEKALDDLITAYQAVEAL